MSTSDDLIPLQDAERIGYLEGVRRDLASDPRRAVALYARPVNLLEQPCTCDGSGRRETACPVCLAWDATSRINKVRGGHAVRL